MKSGFSSLFAVILLFVPIIQAHAQYGGVRLSYGICFGTAAKVGLVQQPRMKYGPWGEVNAGMYAALSGVNPGSMSARLNTQFSRDDIYIKVGDNESYFIETAGFLLNPEVCIPLRNRNGDYKFEALAGIGAHIVADQSLGIRNVDGSFGGSYLDNLADTVFKATRTLQPFITAGFAFRFNRRGSLILRIRQDMQNAFYSDREVTLYSSTDVKAVNLSVQATRLLIGFEIRLGKLPEIY